MSKKIIISRTLKEDLLDFVNENIVDQTVDDVDEAVIRISSELLLLKTGDEWKNLDTLKESILNVSSIPAWLDIGRSDIKDGIDRQIKEAALGLQAIFKAHAKDPVTKPKKAKAQKRSKMDYIWQYASDRNKSGWANYDTPASDFIENVYQAYKANRGDVDVRAVRSGGWEYQVDFLAMKQTNTQHEAHRIRDIRRLAN